MTRYEAMLALCCMTELGLNVKLKLLSLYGRPELILRMTAAQIKEAGLMTETQLDEYAKWNDPDKINTVIKEMEKRDIRFISLYDDEYPEKLKQIKDLPLGLFVHGIKSVKDVDNNKCVAVIGARRPTDYGRMMADEIGEELGRAGAFTISGLAAGIDSIAHKGTLKGGGRTYAVLGSGADVCYPRANISLYTQVAENGAIISEYPPGTPPDKWHFPLRNRIISALSDGICVIEAKKVSGTGITVDYGLDQGKDIFALPGRVTDELSEGTNQLIVNGARAVISAEDIMNFYNINTKKDNNSKFCLDKSEELVYSAIRYGSDSLSGIVEKTHLTGAEAAVALMSLEIKGLIEDKGAGRYRLIRRID